MTHSYVTWLIHIILLSSYNCYVVFLIHLCCVAYVLWSLPSHFLRLHCVFCVSCFWIFQISLAQVLRSPPWQWHIPFPASQKHWQPRLPVPARNPRELMTRNFVCFSLPMIAGCRCVWLIVSHINPRELILSHMNPRELTTNDPQRCLLLPPYDCGMQVCLRDMYVSVCLRDMYVCREFARELSMHTLMTRKLVCLPFPMIAGGENTTNVYIHIYTNIQI